MKRIKVVIVVFFVFVFLILWNGLLSDIIPRERTHFRDYREFRNFLNEKHCFGSSAFGEELPETSQNEVFYFRNNWNALSAAYSMQLPSDERAIIAEERICSYREKWGEWSNVQMYVAKKGERYYIEESEWFRRDLDFVQNVLQKPDVQKEYFLLIALKLDGPKGNRYSGVILSETTNELVEFSFELPNEALDGYSDAWILKEFENK